MKSWERKKSWRNIMQSRFILVLLLALLLFFIWNMTDFLGRVKIAWENRKIAEDRLRDLEDKFSFSI